MTEYRAKTFKSGNSVALRLPKGLGLGEGEEIVIVPHSDGRFSMWKKNQALEVLMALYGSVSPGFMAEGRGDIDQEAYDWDTPASDQAA